MGSEMDLYPTACNNDDTKVYFANVTNDVT